MAGPPCTATELYVCWFMLNGKDKKRKNYHTCSASASVEVLRWFLFLSFFFQIDIIHRFIGE